MLKCKKEKRLLLIILLLCTGHTLTATDYYVKTNGSSIAMGTNWPTAWKTITFAASNAGQGDTVSVSNGTYLGEVAVMSNGSPGSIITFRAFQKGQSIVSGNGSGFSLNNRSFIRIWGFSIRKCKVYGLSLTGASSNNCFSQNSIVSNQSHGIFLNSDTADRNSILSNEVFACLGKGMAINDADENLVQYNQIHHNSTNGIYLFGSATFNQIRQNNIFSNAQYGVFINSETADSNMISLNNIYGYTQSTGIYIPDADNNTVCSNSIRQHKGDGIDIFINSRDNKILRNQIYGNKGTGLNVDGDYNYIFGNLIRGPDQYYGIVITYGDNNTFISNQICRSTTYGVYVNMDVSVHTNNHFIRNEIFSNQWVGIYNNSFFGTHNYFISNQIYGPGQSEGIYMGNNDACYMIGNIVHHHQYWGIAVTGGANYHYVGHNIVYSNGRYGLLIYGNTTTSIMSNIVYGGGQDYGIYMEGGLGWSDNELIIGNQIYHNEITGLFFTNTVSSKIYRNLIYDNGQFNVQLIGNSTNNEFINNTIFKSRSGSGTMWQDTCWGRMYNNIFLSNGTLTGAYGVKRSGSGPVQMAFNIFYGNYSGPTNGGYIWGKGNLFKDPRLDTTTSFTILSPQSYAVDTATNIPGVSSFFSGTGPDMGWRESFYFAILIHWKWAIALSTNSISLAWDDLSNETGYTLFRSLVNDTNSAARIVAFGADTTNYTDTNLMANNNYYYWLKTATNNYYSSFSPVIYTITFPPPPLWRSAEALSPAQAFLVWQNLPNETRYEVYRNTGNDPLTSTKVADILSDQTNHTDPGLKPGTLYYYWLKAYNLSGGSVFSEMRSVQLPLDGTADDLNNVIVAPNPYKPSSMQDKKQVTFFNLTRDFEIQVFTITGLEVFGIKSSTFNGRFIWSAVNRKGEVLKPGVYICHVFNSKSEKKYLKFVIIK